MGAINVRRVVTAAVVSLAGALAGLAVGVTSSGAQTTPGPQLGAWTATTSMPAPRSRTGAVYGNGYVYVIGGQDQSTNVATSYVAPVLSNGTIGTWATTTPLPGPRRTVRPAFANGYVYVAGGNDGFGFRNEVYYARANANGTLDAWNTTTPLPVNSTSHSTLAYNGYLYVVGGNTGPTCVNTVRYAPINANGTIGAWSTTSTLPTPRCGNVETVTVAGGRMYAIGGYNNVDTSNEVAYATVNANGSLGAWTVNANRITTAREYHAVEAMNGYLYVIGGQPMLSGPATASVEVARINADGSVGPFAATTSLPGGRGELMTEQVGSNIYVIGGGTGQSGGNPQANVYLASALPADTTAPTVSITAPAAGASVSGSVNLTATAADNVGVAGVRFAVDGTPVASEDTSAPFAVSWDSNGVANGAHTITAIARDTSGNTTTSAGVNVTVSNAPAPTGEPVLAYGLDEGAGATADDTSPSGNDGTLVNAAWTPSGRYGAGVQLSGANSLVRSNGSVALGTAFTLEAWILNPGNSGYETLLSVGPSRDLYLLNGQLAFSSAGGAFGTVPTGSWQHVAITHDGTTTRAYLNGTQLGTSRTVTYGAVSAALQIGAWPAGGSASDDFFSGTVDEVRIYNRALTQPQVAADMATRITNPPPDTTPPVVSNPQPSGTLPVGTTTATLSVATNEAAACRYGTTPGVAYGAQANAFASTGGTDHTSPLTGLTPGTSTYYVRCQDPALNATTADTAVTFTVAALDTTAPTAGVTAPAPGATVAGTVTITVDATDDVAVAGVQLSIDGTPVGPEDTAAPYSFSWNSTSVPNGGHTIRAVARDTSNNSTTSAGVDVTVDNAPPPAGGPVLAYGLNEGTGTVTDDASPSGNDGTLVNATWNATGRYGTAAQLGGGATLVRSNGAVTLDASFTIEAWVLNPENNGYETILTVGSNRDLYLINGQLTFWTGTNDVSFGAVPAGAWRHVALTYDGTTLRAYLDGVQLGASATVAISATSATLQLGAWMFGGSSYDFLSGSIDEVRVYARALTPAEIVTDRATPIGA
jgi:hypothetical protein